MTQETDWLDLLRLCLVDLQKGETALKDRIGSATGKIGDDKLQAIFKDIEGPAVRAESALGNALRSLDLKTGGDDNLWMRGILDDMERDTRTIEPGVTLDVALIGALRKALAASIVSYDTAIAVAGHAGKRELSEALRQIRAGKAEAEADSRGQG